MRHARALAGSLALLALIMSAVAASMPSGDSEARARILVGEPVAVIATTPQTLTADNWVSNAFNYSLDGSGSHDPDGTIVNYTWRITYGSSVTYMYGVSKTYLFSAVGLYQIELTVTDNASMTGSAFLAVLSKTDYDSDGLPDKWEMDNFGITSWDGADDPDGDGYTNAEEYEAGTDPNHRDTGPGVFSIIPLWGYALFAIAIAVILVLFLLPKWKRKQKEDDAKKIQVALEIEKALEEE